MNDLLSFFTSEFAVAITWLCTVASTLYAIILKRENSHLKLSITTNQTVDHANDNSSRAVIQNADKAVYTEKNIGDMNINM